jgi:phage-related protein
VLNNTGNAVMYPVFQVTGGGAFTLSNDTTGLAIIFTGSYSGYAEIDTFRNTIYQNGSGANLKDGIDVENSDFFGLVPGNNVISISGGSVTVLWQAAWV